MLYLTLRQYEYVTAIARQQSLSAAASELNVSQPALSAALSKIEAHLGTALFQRRKGASLVLTPEGRAFVRKADGLLAQATMIENNSAPQPRASSLSLGCFTDLAPFFLAPALRVMRRHFAGTALTYRADGFENLTTAMTQGLVDLTITYDLGLDAGFDRRVLGTAVPSALLPLTHPLAQCEAVSLAALANEPLILFQEGLSAQHALSLFRNNGLRPRVVHRAASLEIMRSLAAHAEGVGFTYSNPPGPVSYDGKTVVAVPVNDPDAAESIILARHGTGPADPLIAKVMETLVRDIRADPH